MRNFIVAGLLCIGSICIAADAPIFEINDFKGGIQNNIDSTLIPDNAVQDARNVYFDGNTVATKRKGMSKLNSIAIGDSNSIVGQYEYKLSNGIRYHIAHSSTNLYYRQSGAGFISFDSDVSSTTPCNYAVFMDTLNYCDGSTTTNISAWDGGNVFSQTTSYQPKYLITWQQRLWQAGDGDEPSTARSCGFQNSSDWDDLVNLSTSPVEWLVNTQDGQNITGLFLSPNGNLGILKEDSVWELGGNDKDDFYLRLIIADNGCVDSGSVASREGVVTWLSSEGYIGYDGNGYSIISDKIYSTILSIQQLEVNSGSFVKNTVDEWSNYVSIKNIDVIGTPGEIKLDLEEESSPVYYRKEIAMAASSSDTFKVICGSGSVANDASTVFFEISSEGNIENQTTIIASTRPVNISHESIVLDSSNNILALVVGDYSALEDGSDTRLVLSSSTDNGVSWTNTVISSGVGGNSDYDTSIHVNSTDYFHVFFTSTTPNPDEIYYTSYTATGFIEPILIVSTAGVGTGYNDLSSDIDNVDVIHFAYSHNNTVLSVGGYVYYSSMSVSDSSFIGEDLVYYNPAPILGKAYIYTPSIQCDSNNNPSIAYILDHTTSTDQVAISSYTNGVWYNNVVLIDQGGAIDTHLKIDSDDNYHLFWNESAEDDFYHAVYDSNGNELTAPYVFDSYTDRGSAAENYAVALDSDDVLCTVVAHDNPADYRLDIKIASGTYISNIYDTSYTLPIWDTFSIDISQGDYDYANFYRSSDSASNILNETWIAFTENSIPSGTPSQFLQYKVTISSYSVQSQVTSIDTINFTYHALTGSQRLQSTKYDTRIWNAVSISSSTVLDRILVWDDNNAWTFFDSQVHVVSLLNYNGTLYMGSSDGFIYTLNTSDNDNGKPINAYIKTKDYDLGSIVTHKTLNLLYLTALESGNWNLSLDYYLDKSSSYNETFNIDLDLTDNLINYKIPMRRRDRFYTINFKIYNSNANEPFNFLGLYSTYKGYRLR